MNYWWDKNKGIEGVIALDFWCTTVSICNSCIKPFQKLLKLMSITSDFQKV